jgi:crotonobetaine/carnitine-CoA ligase
VAGNDLPRETSQPGRGLPPLEQRTFIAAFERALQSNPDGIAQTDRNSQWTFAESFERSARLGAGLRAQGVGFQQPVAMMLDNSFDTIHVWSGLSLGGMIEVPINTAYRGRFLSYLLNNSEAEVLVVEDRYLDRLAAVAGDLTSLRTVVVRGDLGAADPALTSRFRVLPFSDIEAHAGLTPVRVSPADLIGYMYTSGTTGPSKGVLIPHAYAYTYASREDLERPRSGDRILVTLPVFHLAGQWYGVYQSLIHQVPCFLEPGFSASGFWPAVRKHGATMTLLMGGMAELLQRQPERDSDAENPLELAVVGPLPRDLEAFRKRYGVALATVYGSSEIGAVLNSPPETLVPGEAGLCRPGYELRVVDAQAHDVPVGQIGELWVRGQVPYTVMQGYHKYPEKTADALRDGWVHTGDAFRTDADGHFYFADRVKDALRRRGENVSSFELEAVINEYPGVFENAVVAVPSEIAEDDIKVVIVPAKGSTIDPEHLTRFLIDRLPYFMVPRYLEIVDELPKTPTQKVVKHVLREQGLSGNVWDREAAGIIVRRG